MNRSSRCQFLEMFISSTKCGTYSVWLRRWRGGAEHLSPSVQLKHISSTSVRNPVNCYQEVASGQTIGSSGLKTLCLRLRFRSYIWWFMSFYYGRKLKGKQVRCPILSFYNFYGYLIFSLGCWKVLHLRLRTRNWRRSRLRLAGSLGILSLPPLPDTSGCNRIPHHIVTPPN